MTYEARGVGRETPGAALRRAGVSSRLVLLAGIAAFAFTGCGGGSPSGTGGASKSPANQTQLNASARCAVARRSARPPALRAVTPPALREYAAAAAPIASRVAAALGKSPATPAMSRLVTSYQALARAYRSAARQPAARRNLSTSANSIGALERRVDRAALVLRLPSCSPPNALIGRQG